MTMPSMVQLVRPSEKWIAARKREIAERYARKYRSKPATFSAIRASELTRLYTRRYGDELPNTDAGVVAMRVMLDHLGNLQDSARRISRWLDHWAPWLTDAAHERAINDATQHPLRYRADKIAWKLRVTKVERDQLQLHTIGAIDCPKPQRQQEAKARRRERDTIRRRAKGSKPRPNYSNNKLWKPLGISRAKWYRLGKPTA